MRHKHIAVLIVNIGVPKQRQMLTRESLNKLLMNIPISHTYVRLNRSNPTTHRQSNKIPIINKIKKQEFVIPEQHTSNLFIEHQFGDLLKNAAAVRASVNQIPCEYQFPLSKFWLGEKRNQPTCVPMNITHNGFLQH